MAKTIRGEETSFNDKNKSTREFDETLKKFFHQKWPGMIREIIKTPDDHKSADQDNGIDWVVVLSAGTRLYIEVKYLLKTHEEILFEHTVDLTQGKPGWIEKPLFSDYLFYIFAPTQEIYMFNFKILQTVWFNNKERWMNGEDGAFEIETPTRTNNYLYYTLSTCVPIQVVLDEYKKENISRVIEPVYHCLLSQAELLKARDLQETLKKGTREAKQEMAIKRIKELKKDKKNLDN